MTDRKGKSPKTSRRSFLGQAVTAAGGAIAAPKIFDMAQSQSESFPVAAAADGLMNVKLNVNGQTRELTIEPRVTLLDALRERLALTGSKKGCDHGQCGACTVLIDGDRVYSCLTLAVMQEGKQITTIEGLATGNALHPVQTAFIENDGFQCGYCTPGQICASVALLSEVKRGCGSAVTPNLTQPPLLANLSSAEIRERLSGNLCRCSAYNGIVAAVQQSAGQVAPSPVATVLVEEGDFA
jgi:xanthine dehydrogenase YagT iron-sulfur-binding subunit